MMAFARSEVCVMARSFEGEVRKDLVEVVPAEIRNTVGSLDRVLGFSQCDERDVEGAAAHVIDQETAANAAATLGAVAVGVFDGGCGWLIHHAQHGEARVLRGFFGEEALIAVGVGGHAEHSLERLATLRSQIRVQQQLGPQSNHHL